MESRAKVVAMALVVAGLLVPDTSRAVTKCSAKVSGSDGVIAVTASPIVGPLRWGDRPDAINRPFANEATCIDAGKAKKCTLGPTSPQIAPSAITPPDLCTIYVDDGSGPCATYLKGCTPGARAALGHDTSAGIAGPSARECFTGEIYLSAGVRAGGMPAAGQILPIGSFTQLFSQIGNRFGGDVTQSTFALPDLRGAAPDGLTYSICVTGIFPSAF